jgi:hypothetical protein
MTLRHSSFIRRKIAKKCTFIETKGLGHSMHDDELYNKSFIFYFSSE